MEAPCFRVLSPTNINYAKAGRVFSLLHLLRSLELGGQEVLRLGHRSPVLFYEIPHKLQTLSSTTFLYHSLYTAAPLPDIQYVYTHLPSSGQLHHMYISITSSTIIAFHHFTGSPSIIVSMMQCFAYSIAAPKSSNEFDELKPKTLYLPIIKN